MTELTTRPQLAKVDHQNAETITKSANNVMQNQMSVRQNPRIRLKIQLDVAAEIKVQLRKVNPHKKFKKS